MKNIKKEVKQEVKKLDIKNMSETEKEFSKVFGMLFLKKAILPIVLTFVALFGTNAIVHNIWISLIVSLMVAGGGFFYLKKYRDRLQQLKYYEGKVIHLQKKDNLYELLLKNGKLPIKLTIKKGIDEKNARKNQNIKLYFNELEKVAIILK